MTVQIVNSQITDLLAWAHQPSMSLEFVQNTLGHHDAQKLDKTPEFMTGLSRSWKPACLSDAPASGPFSSCLVFIDILNMQRPILIIRVSSPGLLQPSSYSQPADLLCLSRQVLQGSKAASSEMLSTCTLVGCFCAPSTFAAVLCTLLDEPDALPAMVLARLQVLTALLQGAGKAPFAALSLCGCRLEQLSPCCPEPAWRSNDAA